MRCSGTNRFEYGKSFLPTLFRSKTALPFPIGAIWINTIIERFITTSDDLGFVSESAKASFTICSWLRSPSQSGNEKDELYALAVCHWLLLIERPGRGTPLL